VEVVGLTDEELAAYVDELNKHWRGLSGEARDRVLDARFAAKMQLADRRSRGFVPPWDSLPDEVVAPAGVPVGSEQGARPDLPDPADGARGAAAAKEEGLPRRQRIEDTPDARRKAAAQEAATFREKRWFERMAAFAKLVLSGVTGFAGPLPQLRFRGVDDAGKKSIEYRRVQEAYGEFHNVKSRATRAAWLSVRNILEPIAKLEKPLDVEAYRKAQAIQQKLVDVIAEIDDIVRRTHETWKLPPLEKRREALFKVLLAEQEHLKDNPYVIFQNVIMYRNFAQRQADLKDKRQEVILPDGTRYSPPIAMPFGLDVMAVKNRLTFWEQQAHTNAHAAEIAESIKRHGAAMVGATEMAKRNGSWREGMWDGKEKYFPHIVLDFFNGKLKNVHADTEDSFRAFMINPIGSRRAIESDYIKAYDISDEIKREFHNSELEIMCTARYREFESPSLRQVHASRKMDFGGAFGVLSRFRTGSRCEE
jgi:hypothetical protein